MLAVTLLESVVGGIRSSWYCTFFIAISRDVVNHVDGAGTALDPLVCSAGALPTRRRSVRAVRDHAFLPGAAGIWDGERIALADAPITDDDAVLCLEIC